MKFSLCFIFNIEMDKVLLMFKKKGCFPLTWNGVGGKIESTDISPQHGLFREIREEIDMGAIHNLTNILNVEFPNKDILYVYYITTENDNISAKEDEPIKWFDVADILNAPDCFLSGAGDMPYFIKTAIQIENKTK